jgi:hypothetical protein
MGMDMSAMRGTGWLSTPGQASSRPMTPPPAPALVVAGGLAWNVCRSRRGRVTISRWACRNKKVAVPVAVVGGSWVAVHWARYVIEA